MLKCKNIAIICDPLISEYGPLRPALLIAEKLKRKTNEVTIISPIISVKLQKKLELIGLNVVNLHKNPFLVGSESLIWLEEWVREAAFSLNSRGIRTNHDIVLNFSNTLCLSAHIWYAQGPPTVTLDNMKDWLPLYYRLAYLPLSPILKVFDKFLTEKFANHSIKVVANSKYLSGIYRKFGIQVNAVIYPPLDCKKFKPATSRPSEDFVLTYFGKESIFSLIKCVLDAGIKIKAFGSKFSLIPKKILNHPNLEFLGRITDEKLVDLYSNALFTFYPFNDEPFGYIPVESLACGTPVLTFNRQGPKETVVDGKTGWLANSPLQLLKLAIQIWNKGYSTKIRKNCRQRALKYDVNKILQDWLSLIVNFK